MKAFFLPPHAPQNSTTQTGKSVIMTAMGLRPYTDDIKKRLLLLG